jgi:membrane-bound lytic murein transglycosylase D
MKKVSPLFGFVFGVIVTLVIVSQLSFTGGKENRTLWSAPPSPEQLSFAGEAVPLHRWDVKEKLDRELLLNYYGQGNILYLLKLANRNFPLISARLKANGVPDDFKYLCIAESNMQSWAVSKAGAVGPWQFMDGTAPGYGLEVNAEVDQRRDLEKATDAACRYLKSAYQRFGNWTAAAASYNCGQGGYAQQAAFQQTKNYYDLQLPEETNKYIFRILTFKYLMEHATELGYVVKQDELYEEVPVRNVTVSSSISNLAQFAISNGTTYKMLRQLNPWIKGKSLTVRGGKTYVLKLPAN